MITLTALRQVHPFVRGKARDLRVRWALEEAGLPYRTRLLDPGEQDGPEYRALQPFGQIPLIEEEGEVLFESGAIVLQIAERSEALLPRAAGPRARAVQWLMAALNSVEPVVMNHATLVLYEGEEWARLRKPSAKAFAQRKLAAIATALGSRAYLDGETFTAGDLMMATVLRFDPELVTDPILLAYLERCTERPAFKRALSSQLEDLH